MKVPQKKAVPPSRRKRIIIASTIGVLLALPCTWFFSTIYDPFAGEVVDLRTLVPADVDFMVSVPDLPALVKGLESSSFYGDLDLHAGFQRFLSGAGPDVQNVLSSLRQFLSLTADAGPDLPGGFRLLGDVSGTEVVLAGYAPKAPDTAPTWVVLFKPEAWMVSAAINGLQSDLLAPLIDGRLADAGTQIERLENGVVLKIARPGAIVTLALRTHLDTVIVASTPRLIADEVVEHEAPRVPVRLRRNVTPTGDRPMSLQFIVKRALLEPKEGLQASLLEPAFGRDGANALDGFLPTPAGEDLVGAIGLDEALRVTIRIGTEDRRPPDVIARGSEISKDAAMLQMAQVLEFFPHHLFAYAYQQIHPADLAEFCLHEEALVPQSRRQFWFDSMVEMLPRFRPPSGAPAVGLDLTAKLKQELAACFESGVGLAMFTQQRTERIAKSTPGVAVILRIRDQQKLAELIDEIDTIRRDVRSFERYDESTMTRWNITARGLVDDATVSQPGFAIIGSHLVFTNWFRVFNEVLEVSQRHASGSARIEHIRAAIDELPVGTRLLSFGDGRQTFGYFESAKAGWIAAKAEVTEIEKVVKRKELANQATAQRVPPAERDQWIETKWQAWFRGLSQDRNTARIGAEIDAKLGQWRGAFDWCTLHLGREDDDTTLSLTLATLHGDE